MRELIGTDTRGMFVHKLGGVAFDVTPVALIGH